VPLFGSTRQSSPSARIFGTPETNIRGVLSTLEGELVGSIALRRYILSGLSNRLQIPNRTRRKDLSAILAISSGISQGSLMTIQKSVKYVRRLPKRFTLKADQYSVPLCRWEVVSIRN